MENIYIELARLEIYQSRTLPRNHAGVLIMGKNSLVRDIEKSIGNGAKNISSEIVLDIIYDFIKIEQERDQYKAEVQDGLEKYAELFNKRAIRVDDLQAAVRAKLDRSSCPDAFMKIASDTIFEHGCGEIADLKKQVESLRAKIKEAQEQKPFCWYMYDGDDKNGFDDGFITSMGCHENPVSGKPDYRGHFWKAFKLYAAPVIPD